LINITLICFDLHVMKINIDRLDIAVYMSFRMLTVKTINWNMTYTNDIYHHTK